MKLKLSEPFIITARLMVGLQIGKDYISIGYGHVNHENRMVYEIWIDIGDEEYHVDDIRSGCGGGTLQEGAGSLLAFLSAAAESYKHWMRIGDDDENSDLFVKEVAEWAYQNDDEISMLRCMLENAPDLIEEIDDGHDGVSAITKE